MNKYFRYLFSVLFALNFFTAYNQNYGDKEFYLIDSLVLENLDEYDLKLTDSLLNIYHQTDVDSLKLNALANLVDECWDSNLWPRYNEFLLNKSLNLLENSYQEEEKKTLHNFIGHAYINKAYLLITGGSNLKAKEYYNLALEQFKETDNKQSQGEVYSGLALIYSGEGDLLKSIELAEKSIELIKDNIAGWLLAG